MVSQAARPNWFDRNPINQTRQYASSGVAPHATTTRWTYTVPAGKKAWVDSLFIRWSRAAAAAPAARTLERIWYTPSGGIASEVAINSTVDNTIDVSHAYGATQFGEMGAGDVLFAETNDVSTGGSVDYGMSGKISEFDT